MIEWWLVLLLNLEFTALILLGLRVGVLLDKEEALINKNEINKSPDNNESNKQQGYNPSKPMPLNHDKHTNSKTYYRTACQVADSLPRLIAHIALTFKMNYRRR